MSRVAMLETKRAKLVLVVVATLMVAAFQVALEAKPAEAWEVRVSISGAGKVRETTPANLVGSNCISPISTPTGSVGKTCLAGTPGGDYGNLWDVDYVAEPAAGYTFKQWESDGTIRTAVICDRSDPAATTPTYARPTCKFRTVNNMQTRAVFEDTTRPPTPTISGASPSSGITNGAISFSFSAGSDPTFKEFRCSIDSQSAWQACGSGRSWNLAEGAHTIYVESVDFSGNRSFGLASRQFTVDKTLPETTLDAGVGPAAGSTTQDNDPTFAFASNEANSNFDCNLMGPGLTDPAFSPCNLGSPGATTKSYTNLKDGTYTFKVRARDQATNVDATPEERTWTINNTPTVLAGSLTPPKAATGVSRTTNVSAGFSEEMAPTSIANLTTHVSKTVKLQMYDARKKRWTAVPATVDVANTNTTAILDPYGATEGATEKPLAARKKFRATITTGATDAQGNPIARNFVWTFNTGSS